MGRTEALLLIFAVLLLAAVAEYGIVAYTRQLRSAVLMRLLLLILVLYGLLLYFRPANLLLSNGIVLAVTTISGTLIATGLATRGSLISFSIACSLADIISFTIGPTRILQDRFGGSINSLITFLTVTITINNQVIPLIGIGDLMIMSAYFVALRQMGYSPLVAFGAPLVGIIAAVIVGLVFGGAFGIPFMAAAVIIVLLLNHNPGSADKSPGPG